MWLRRKKRDEYLLMAKLAEEMSKPDRPQLLAACANDSERATLCMEWAEESRAEWFQGRKEAISDLLLSRNERYRDYSPSARVAIAKQGWMNSPTAKSIVSDEQMFTRWADNYKGSERVA